MRNRELLTLLVLGVGSLALLASGAAAEWLVTSDGTRLEIVGPWKVEGKLVTFSLPNGTLGSMRLTEVDLEASEALLDERAASAVVEPEQPTAKPKAVMVITDADVGHPTRRGGDGSDDAGPGEASVSTSPGLRVTGWRESVDMSSQSVQISGTLQNPTENPATSIQLDVVLYGEDGQPLETSRARLDQGFLNPGASLRFEATFNDTLSYDDVQFEIRSRGFMANPPAEEEPEEESGEEESA